MNQHSHTMQSTMATRLLNRQWPKIKQRYARHANKHRLSAFETSLQQDLPRLVDCLSELYQHHWDFYFHLEQTVSAAAQAWFSSETDPKPYHSETTHWINSAATVGATGYVDLFAGDLKGLAKKADYLNDLGVNYLHLLPFFEVPEGDSDGGYAIKNYGNVNAKLGTLDDLKDTAKVLKQAGVKLVLDFVFNHTSDQHEWALKAKAGDTDYQDYYFVFKDTQLKHAYAPFLRDIFPDKRVGCFTWNEALQADIWTTFNSFQWDLNYQNPAVYTAMCEEMLKLVDAGADVIRLDALAFTWKEAGTVCENLPKAHRLIQAFNAFLRIAAPHVLLKSEAIVAPDEVVKYIDEDECQLSYNPNFMALMWEALATRETKLLHAGSLHRSDLPSHTTWVNYLRCHDDIGWAFADSDAWQVGINPHDHRYFLNQFYTHQFPGSFANGVPFQENPANGDCRISGTLASLVGVELAQNSHASEELELALRRIELLHGVMLAFKGIPLIYLGDELAMLNDYSYHTHPDHFNDSRWVHRVDFNKLNADTRSDTNTLHGRVFTALKNLIELRKANPVFGSGELVLFNEQHPHLFAFARVNKTESIHVLANFSEHNYQLDPAVLNHLGIGQKCIDLFTQQTIDNNQPLAMDAYQLRWIHHTNNL